MTSVAPPLAIPWPEAAKAWMRVAALSFGGPAGQIAVMHRILVEEKRWIGDRRFLQALNYCMLLPGPEAQQLATYVGWLLHGVKGGLFAGAMFVLPGFLAILALSYAFVLFGDVPLVEGVLFGLSAAVLAVVLQAVWRISKRALSTTVALGTAAAAFVAIFFFSAPFPVIVAAAALFGYLATRAGRDWFRSGGGHGGTGSSIADADTVLGEATPEHARPSRATAILSAACLLAWLAPVAAVFLLIGPDDILTELAVFFSGLALVTFGGAYAVLAFVAQEAVEARAWLSAQEMLTGLALAEAAPGPLIKVLQYVGFLAAYRDPGDLSPLLAATCASVLVTWVTFAPSFLFIFAGAPFAESLRGQKALQGALAAITAAVVGVILNLAVWLALNVVFAGVVEKRLAGLRLLVPDLTSFQAPAVTILVGASVALLRFKAPLPPTLAVAAVLGGVWRLAFSV